MPCNDDLRSRIFKARSEDVIHSFASMSGGSLVLKSQSYQKCNIKHQLNASSHHVAHLLKSCLLEPANEGDTWRFEKPLRSSIDWAYNKLHWTTSFGRSSRSESWLESDRLLQNRADS
eukprot:scaffold10676_cov74-Skeletonema_dohrnii-CCMP3373.AAC.1